MLDLAHSYSHIVPSSGEADKNIIKSAQRVLEVFEFFADVRRASSATEIAHSLGYPQSSTSMLLRSLVSLGYLNYQRETRTYEPTIRLSLLGGWVPQRIEVASHIIDTLTKLYDEFGETLVLGQQHRHYVRYIYVLQRPGPGVNYYIRPGTLRPAATGATGLALLTLNAERDVVSMVNRTNAEEPDPSLWLRRQDVLDKISRARQAGYAYHERVLEDFVGVQLGVLLPQEDDAPRMALGMITRKPRFKPREDAIVARLLDIAQGG